MTRAVLGGCTVTVAVVVLMLRRGVIGSDVGLGGCVKSKPVVLSYSQNDVGEPMTALR